MLEYLGFTHKIGRMVPYVFPIVAYHYTRGVSVPDRRRPRNPDPTTLDARATRAHAAASPPTRAEPSESLRIARPSRANMPCARPTASAVRASRRSRGPARWRRRRARTRRPSLARARARAGPSGDVKKVVLAYSGGLDTSIILKWLQDTYGCEVVTRSGGFGPRRELEPARAKAAQFGVKEIFVDDLREEFVRDYVFRDVPRERGVRGDVFVGDVHRYDRSSPSDKSKSQSKWARTPCATERRVRVTIKCDLNSGITD